MALIPFFAELVHYLADEVSTPFTARLVSSWCDRRWWCPLRSRQGKFIGVHACAGVCACRPSERKTVFADDDELATRAHAHTVIFPSRPLYLSLYASLFPVTLLFFLVAQFPQAIFIVIISWSVDVILLSFVFSFLLHHPPHPCYYRCVPFVPHMQTPCRKRCRRKGGRWWAEKLDCLTVSSLFFVTLTLFLCLVIVLFVFCCSVCTPEGAYVRMGKKVCFSLYR